MTHPFHPLDPDRVALDAFELYRQGGCMYGVFTSIVSSLAETCGEPYASFPSDMMRFGSGGLAGRQSLCGAINGAAAAISLACPKRSTARRAINALCEWHNETPLPQFVPPGEDPVPTSVAGSELCAVAIDSWNAATDGQIMRSKRCGRVTADIARKAAQLLNESHKTSSATQGSAKDHAR